MTADVPPPVRRSLVHRLQDSAPSVRAAGPVREQRDATLDLAAASPGEEALLSYIEHFQKRVVQDAITEASAGYWRKRAAHFENAMPRPGDYTGAASTDELASRHCGLAMLAQACRSRATISMLGGDL